MQRANDFLAGAAHVAFSLAFLARQLHTPGRLSFNHRTSSSPSVQPLLHASTTRDPPPRSFLRQRIIAGGALPSFGERECLPGPAHDSPTGVLTHDPPPSLAVNHLLGPSPSPAFTTACTTDNTGGRSNHTELVLDESEPRGSELLACFAASSFPD